MKKVLLIAAAIVSLAACKRDNDEQEVQVQEPSVVGVWKQTKMVVISGADNSVIEEELPNECEQRSSHEFTQDGRLINTVFVEDGAGRCIEDGSDVRTYVYNPSTKVLSVTDSDEKTDMEVLLLTETEFHFIEDDDSDVNGDGVLDKLVFYFTKVR